MPLSEVVSSPVLVGRDDLLGLAERRIAEAAAGNGQLLLVHGEAGGGKTRLLGSIARRAVRQGFLVLRAAAFHGDVESSGGLLLELADDLRRCDAVAAQGAGVALGERLRASQAGGDAHRLRRLLVQDLAETLHRLDPRRSTLVLLEDLHWADQLSLEVLRHWAVRLPERQTLVVGAYRSDELFPGTAVRDWRADLLSRRAAEEIRVPRLTHAQTATLISAVLGRPAPARLVDAVQRRSDGIPLHVEELLAAAGTDGGLAADDLDGVQVPETLADAVLVRARALSEEDRHLVAAAAAIGRTFDFDLVAEVADAEPADVDAGLRRLQGLHLVQQGASEQTFDFRHALIRDALYGTVPLPTRRSLHGRVATAAVARGYHDSFVSAQFEQAGVAIDAHRHALAGAREATALSAHSEALVLYRRALRTADPAMAPVERAHLLAAFAAEAAAVDDNDEAAQAYEGAIELFTRAGESVEAAGLVPALVGVRHLLGDPLAVREKRLREALSSIDGGAGATRVEAGLLAGLAAAYMLDRRLDNAIDYGRRGRALSRGAGDDAADLNAAVTLGSALVFAGRMDEGWGLLEDAVARARAEHLEAEAARAYRMIGSSASVLVDYDRAMRWLTEGIAYAERVELGNHRSYMLAHLAHVAWATGDWETATTSAQQALADGRGGITTRITATYVLGYVALGRGDWSGAAPLLEEALALGESMGELQRVSPPLWGLAEAALLQGDFERAVSLCTKGFGLSLEVDDAAYLFPFALTGIRALLQLGDTEAARSWLRQCSKLLVLRAIPGTLPALAHAAGLLAASDGEPGAQQQLATAAAQWHALGRWWEATWGDVDTARAARASRRHVEAAVLAEAVTTAAATLSALPLLSAAADQQRRDDERAWHPLTEREWAVAQLVAEGLTNRAIAERLVVSPKTVSTHVEHILAKLGAARRAEIAAWAVKVDA